MILNLIKNLLTELGDEVDSLDLLSEQLIVDFLKSKNNVVYLIKNATTIVGLFTLSETTSIYAGGKYGIINEFYIIPAERQKNIGRAAINFIKQFGQNKGWQRIVVTAPTGSEWTRTIKFYEENGFVFTGPKLKLILNE
ncbi:MAG: GNAT family N-acetyltransferase [Sediminibacterium sp.]|nr:GNAT family N-acetyltransferase [Sediminibacterium sp.]